MIRRSFLQSLCALLVAPFVKAPKAEAAETGVTPTGDYGTFINIADPVSPENYHSISIFRDGPEYPLKPILQINGKGELLLDGLTPEGALVVIAKLTMLDYEYLKANGILPRYTAFAHIYFVYTPASMA